MDLKQIKLSKSEWDGIEISVSKSELDILRLITSGFLNVNLKVNKTNSIFTHLKIEYNPQIEEFLYVKFFADKIKLMVEKYNILFIRFGADPTTKKNKNNLVELENNIYYINVASIVRLKSSDQIRLSRLNSLNDDTNMYEVVLYNHLEQMIEHKYSNKKTWIYFYYTLTKLIQNNVEKVNKHLKEIIQTFIKNYEPDVDLLSGNLYLKSAIVSVNSCILGKVAEDNTKLGIIFCFQFFLIILCKS